MKPDEVKMRIMKFLDKTIDAYIPKINILDKVKNGTIKLWLDQNINKIDPILAIFVDSQGEIDVKFISKYYEDILFENGEFKMDIRDLIPDDYGIVKEILPNKIILFKRNDLNDIFEDNYSI